LRFAAHFGQSPSEFLERHTSPEISEWIAFDNIYGFPDIYCLIAQLARAVNAPYGKESLKLGDLVPFFKPDVKRRKQTPADHLAILQAMSRRGRIR
jgi:hypothetical protein